LLVNLHFWRTWVRISVVPLAYLVYWKVEIQYRFQKKVQVSCFQRNCSPIGIFFKVQISSLYQNKWSRTLFEVWEKCLSYVRFFCKIFFTTKWQNGVSVCFLFILLLIANNLVVWEEMPKDVWKLFWLVNSTFKQTKQKVKKFWFLSFSLNCNQ